MTEKLPRNREAERRAPNQSRRISFTIPPDSVVTLLI
jgi:hypothetical protein